MGKGFERQIDDLGRICLPMEMRTALGIKAGDKIDIELRKESIILRKAEKIDVLEQMRLLIAENMRNGNAEKVKEYCRNALRILEE